MGNVIPKKTFSRVTTGCLCCRKRKIKCDEAKPSCNNCIKGLYICEWSTEKQTLHRLAQFKPKKFKQKKNKFIDVSNVFQVKISNKLSPPKESKSVINIQNKIKLDVKKPKCDTQIFTQDQMFSTTEAKTEEKDQRIVESLEIVKNTKDEDALFREYLKYLGKKCILSFKNNLTIDFQMSARESQFFDAFVNGFMVSISPQLTHENLQPSSVIIPRGMYNSTLRNVFYICGATYMSWNKKELKPFAEAQYQNCISSLQLLINNNGRISGNEDLLLITTMTFCLRERYQCQDTIRNELFLIASLKIIYYWIGIRFRNNNNNNEPPRNFDSNDDEENILFDYFDQVTLESELNEIFDYLSKRSSTNLNNDYALAFTSLKSAQDSDNFKYNETLSTREDIFSQIYRSSYSISAFERTMIESFIYNYCVSLLNFNSGLIKYVESPFKVFKDLRLFLTEPIYNTIVPWMNNPVMGAALPAFELVAKANWLRHKIPLDENSLKAAESLQRMAEFYTSPFLPQQVKFEQPEQIQKKLLESCYIGVLTAKASYILLTKIVYPNHLMDSSNIIRALDTFYKTLKKISLHSQGGGICFWAFIIAGLATSNEEDRRYLLYRIDTFGELKKSEAMMRVKHFLTFHWENSENSWDVFLEPNGFNELFI
jgi:hypothetical protein